MSPRMDRATRADGAQGAPSTIELALVAMLREAARTRADRRATLTVVEGKAA